MKLVVQACSLLNAIELNKLGVDKIIVGDEKYASRLPGNVNLEEIKSLVQNKVDIRVSINNLFSETQLLDLQNYLLDLYKIGVKEIIFHDFAVVQILKENNLLDHFHLTYNPETLVTSYGQFNFYKKNGIKAVSLARELFINEIKEISANNDCKMELEIQCHGLSFMMQSRWSLLSNYKDYIEQQQINVGGDSSILIKEDTRRLGNYIYEDTNGSHMFTGYDLQTLDILEKINDLNINYIRIDSACKNSEWIVFVSHLYLKAIKMIKENEYDEKQKNLLISELKGYDTKILYSNGFLGKAKDNPHVERGEDSE
jgi:putative protease